MSKTLASVVIGLVGSAVLASSVLASVAAFDSAPIENIEKDINILKDKVQCTVCPRECILADGQRGFCHVRQNIGGNIADTCNINYHHITYHLPVHKDNKSPKTECGIRGYWIIEIIKHAVDYNLPNIA